MEKTSCVWRNDGAVKTKKNVIMGTKLGHCQNGKKSCHTAGQ